MKHCHNCSVISLIDLHTMTTEEHKLTLTYFMFLNGKIQKTKEEIVAPTEIIKSVILITYVIDAKQEKQIYLKLQTKSI